MKKFIAALSLAAALCLPGAPALAKKLSADELLQSRAAVLWIGGNRVGDLMVGADARLRFQFIDRALTERIYSEPDSFPDQILWNAPYIDKASRSRCNLVILVYTAVSRWNFDPSKITVNGEPIPKNRVYSSLLAIPTGALAAGTEDVIVFGVPRALSRPGGTLVFAYGDHAIEFSIPGK